MLNNKFSLLSVLIPLVFSGCTKVNKCTLEKIGELRFRRSYVDLIHGAAIEKDSLSDRPGNIVIQEDPVLEESLTNTQLQLKKKLEKAGFIRNNRLVQERFKTVLLRDTIEMDCGEGERLLVNSAFDTKLSSEILLVKGKHTNDMFNLETTYPVSLFELDLYGDRVKELVVLNEYYFMNGDTYTVAVYRVK